MVRPPWEYPLWGCLMSPFGAAWGALMALRRRRYQSGAAAAHRFDCPVISVGNLTVGGVGKTPFVSALLQELSHLKQCVVLARGYGAHVGDGLDDEGHMLQARYPEALVIQGADRVAAAAGRVDDASVIILDDGAQHLRIARDLDIMIFDTQSLAAPRFVLPAGPWRENLSAAAAADIFVLSREDESDEQVRARAQAVLRGLFPETPIVTCRHRVTALLDAKGEMLALESLKNTRVVAASAIGRPGSFKRSLTMAGASVAATVDLPDHAAWGPEHVARVEAKRAGVNADFIVTTEKDAAKLSMACSEELRNRLRVLRVDLDFVDGGEVLKARLEDLFPAKERS